MGVGSPSRYLICLSFGLVMRDPGGIFREALESSFNNKKCFSLFQVLVPTFSPFRHNLTSNSTTMAKVGINGFGRIGRLVLRAALEKGVNVSYLRNCWFDTFIAKYFIYR